MVYVIYFVKQTVLALLGLLDFAMLLRAILSWFDQLGESKISMFLYAITEPLILPIRRLCNKMNWFQGTPLDMPFMLTLIVILVLQTLVEVLL
ncbi:MAG: YggT family protein [Clostridia bacterium]|nr:YggT family protein [Clostridia bacterium]